MDVYITFFSRFPGNRVYIYNGFSFGREKREDDIDLFFSISSSKEEILGEIQKYNPEKIWCSLSLFSQYEQIRDITDNRWIIGGPITRKKFFEKDLNFNCVTSTLESFLNKSLSSEYDFYLKDFIKNFKDSKITYNCSVGYGCYWRKCSFCSYKKFSKNSEMVMRDTDKLFEKLPPFIDENNNKLIVHTCIDSLPSGILKKILSGRFKIEGLTSFIRADESILTAFKENPRNLKNFTFSVGLEGFSQCILDKLEKGVLLQNVINLVKHLLENEATVYLSFLGGFPFLTKEIVEDSIRNIKVLKEFQKLKGKLFSIYNDKIYWPSVDVISNYSFPIKEDKIDGYLMEIPKSSDQYVYNKKIEEEILSSFDKIISLN